MSGLSMFFKENVEQPKNVKFVASTRFKDAKGKPVEWEIKAITSEENEKLRKLATTRVPVKGSRNQFTQEIDMGKYQASVCAACTVYPELNNAELQDSWGAMGAEDLLTKLLLVGEYTAYTEKVFEINGFDVSDDELVEEAKN